MFEMDKSTKRNFSVAFIIAIILFGLAIWFVSHNDNKISEEERVELQVDTIMMTDTIYQVIPDSIVEYSRDSLYSELFIANYKLRRIEYYCNIVDRNPSQIKYLKGWIKRTLTK